MVKPSPPRRLPATERRAAILKTALPLFAVRGFDGTTTRDLARASGVTEPVLYRHFPSKAALFDEVLDGAGARIGTRLAEALVAGGSAADRLAALADRLDPILRDLEDEFRVVNGAAATHADPKVVAKVRAIYVTLGDALSKALARGGLAAGVDPRTAGYLVLEVGLGAALARPLGVPAVVRDGYGAEVLGLLRAALTRSRRR